MDPTKQYYYQGNPVSIIAEYSTGATIQGPQTPPCFVALSSLEMRDGNYDPNKAPSIQTQVARKDLETVSTPADLQKLASLGSDPDPNLNAPSGFSETSPVVAGVSTQSQDSGEKPKVNVNTANLEDFDGIPGIGQSRALRLFERRPEEGYRDIEHMQEIHSDMSINWTILAPLVEFD